MSMILCVVLLAIAVGLAWFRLKTGAVKVSDLAEKKKAIAAAAIAATEAAEAAEAK